MKTFLELNATVPDRGHPGSPVLVYFDNGDWEIAFAGDVDFIERGSNHFAGSVSVIDLITEARALFDFDGVDSDGEVAHLYIEGETNVGKQDEDVFILYETDEPFMTVREHAENLIKEDDEAFNFIPLVDLLEDIRDFVARNGREMSVYGDGDPFESDEDVEDDH